MSDTRRRAVERAAEQGDPALRARLLTERARQGELTETGLRIAAYVGDPDALVAVGARRDTPTRVMGAGLGSRLPFEAIALAEWVAGLARLEPTAHARAALAQLRAVLPLWVRACPRDGRPHRVVDRLEAWVHCPCGPCAGVVRLLADDLVELDVELPPWAAHVGAAAEQAGGAPLERRAAALVALHALRALAAERLLGPGAPRAAGLAGDDPQALASDPRWEDALIDSVPALREAVRVALVPWALTPRALGGPAASPADVDEEP